MNQRPLKFRAWTDQGTEGVFRMVYDVGVLPLSAPNDWVENQNGLFLKPSEHNILMQFTGLKDKNGKEIYEGDILQEYRSYSGKNGKVCYAAGDYYRKVVEWNIGGRRYAWGIAKGEKYEVIGNVYENPELLKP